MINGQCGSTLVGGLGNASCMGLWGGNSECVPSRQSATGREQVTCTPVSVQDVPGVGKDLGIRGQRQEHSCQPVAPSVLNQRREETAIASTFHGA